MYDVRRRISRQTRRKSSEYNTAAYPSRILNNGIILNMSTPHMPLFQIAVTFFEYAAWIYSGMSAVYGQRLEAVSHFWWHSPTLLCISLGWSSIDNIRLKICNIWMFRYNMHQCIYLYNQNINQTYEQSCMYSKSSWKPSPQVQKVNHHWIILWYDINISGKFKASTYQIQI